MNLMLRYGVGAFFALAVCSGFTSCSSNPRSIHAVRKIIPSTLRVRRPHGAGADPEVGPGGADYKSAPLPNAQLDCESVNFLLSKLHVAALRTCLKSIKDKQSVTYRLRREAEPYLELRDFEKAPDCLRQELPRIPVPREIFFQARNEQGALECYSARLPLEVDQKMGFRLPIERWALRLEFPFQVELKTDSEFERVFAAWALTPMWSAGSGKGLAAKVVTTPLCKQCLGEAVFLKELPSEPEALPMWPE